MVRSRFARTGERGALVERARERAGLLLAQLGDESLRDPGRERALDGQAQDGVRQGGHPGVGLGEGGADHLG